MRSVGQIITDAFHFFTDQMHYEHPLDVPDAAPPTDWPEPSLRSVGGLGPREDDGG